MTLLMKTYENPSPDKSKLVFKSTNAASPGFPAAIVPFLERP
jgi:hypothetical protein